MILAEMGTVSRAFVCVAATEFLEGLNSLKAMQIFHGLSEKTINVPALLYNVVLFTQQIFQVSLQIDNCIKSEIVSASFTCHSGENDTPSIISCFCCSGLLHCNSFVIVKSLQSYPLLCKPFLGSLMGVSEVGVSSAGN